MSDDDYFSDFITGLKRRNPHEKEFHQAVEEVAIDVIPYIENNPRYPDALVLECLSEPDRVISLRICWVEDDGNIRANHGHRIQNCNAIDP